MISFSFNSSEKTRKKVKISAKALAKISTKIIFKTNQPGNNINQEYYLLLELL